MTFGEAIAAQNAATELSVKDGTAKTSMLSLQQPLVIKIRAEKS